MAITYQKTPLEWKNEGAEPSNALKTGGFEPGMKPTADAFNYFWHNAGEVEKELQSKLSAEATARETADTTLQNNINKKQATITGAATTVTSSNLTANRALISNSSGKIGVSAITDTELGYLDGTTSNVQTQLNNVNTKAESLNTETNTRIDNLKSGVVNLFLNSADYSAPWNNNSATITNDTHMGAKIVKVSKKNTGMKYFMSDIVSRQCISIGDELTMSCYARTDNPTEIEFKAIGTLISGIVGYLTNEWKQYSFTFTVTEQIYNSVNTIRFEPLVDCDTDCFVYTSNYILTKGNMIADWLPAPEDTSNSIAGLQTALASETTARETADTTLQSNIDKKQATITGAATTITSSNLTTNRALISNSSGKIGVSAITDTELGYLDGITSNVQNQLNKKTGYDMSGLVVYAQGADVSTTAGTKAEILNDYRTRTFTTDKDYEDYYRANTGNIASGNYSTAAGNSTTAIGNDSFATGYQTIAIGSGSHTEGIRAKAIGKYSHAEGSDTQAIGFYSHAEGSSTQATGQSSHAEGSSTQATGQYSHAEGYQTEATGDYSHAEGSNTVADRYQHAQGRYNKSSAGPTSWSDMTGDLFMVGNGTSATSRGNALRTAAEGRTYGLASFLASGADYAEMWEYADGNPENEDRRGYFVTVDENNKIHIANAEDDYILGVISSCPVVVGDVQSEIWHGMYLTDIYGNKLTETVEVPETTDEQTGTIIPAHTETRWILNPDYDPEQEYICREDRPEWDAVGLLGKLIVNDDGTAKVGGFCKVANGGIATKSEDKSGWRVLERLDDKHIKILYR